MNSEWSMVNKGKNVQECDATGDDSSTSAKYKNQVIYEEFKQRIEYVNKHKITNLLPGSPSGDGGF